MAPTIRGDLVGSVHLTDRLGARVVLTAGQRVPDGYTVGDHLLEGASVESEPAAPAAPPVEPPPAPPADPPAPPAPEPVKKAAAAKKATAKRAPAKKAAAKRPARKRAGS